MPKQKKETEPVTEPIVGVTEAAEKYFTEEVKTKYKSARKEVAVPAFIQGAIWAKNQKK